MQHNQPLIIELYTQKNISACQIAKQLKIPCAKTVISILQKHNIRIRTRAEAVKLLIGTTRIRKIKLPLRCECGGIRSKGSTVCRQCDSLNNRGPNHHSWKGGKPKCEVCSKQLSVYKISRKTLLCQKCFNIEFRGSKHWNWKGGCGQRPMNTEAYKNWRTSVFKRDDFTCQDCKKRGGKLNAHHIVRWADVLELRYETGNGRTLCEACHRNYSTRQKTFAPLQSSQVITESN